MTPDQLYATVEATWPPAAARQVGPWTIREGQGGGQRVSAATAHSDWTEADIPAAEQAMRDLGQTPLFMIRVQDDRLDAALAARGYAVKDPVVAYAGPAEQIATPPANPMKAFPHWPPLAITLEIWEETGIGPGRVAVMHRAAGPKCAVLGRIEDRAAGALFVALHGPVAMVHAVEVLPAMRRKGLAQAMIRRAAGWAVEQGADTLSLVVTQANAGARALYERLGMQTAGAYHYRVLTTG